MSEKIFRMTIPTRHHTIVTSHGFLAVEESGQGSIPVLLILGNSSCRAVFRHQLQGPLAENHRLIAFDLPGHGQSGNAPDSSRNYRATASRRNGSAQSPKIAWTKPSMSASDRSCLPADPDNLWEGHCHRLAGLGHAPFWEAPGNFDPILERFLQDVETGRAATHTL